MGKLLLFAALLVLALPGLSRAADCSGDNPSGICGSSNAGSRAEQFAAREAYCGNNLWRTTRCYVQGKVKITFSKPGVNDQQVCWDALENIIDQCGSRFVRGTYDYNGLYTLTRCVSNDGGCVFVNDA